MLKKPFQKPSTSSLSLIAEKLNLRLSNPMEFYKSLSRKCGDYDAEFIENEKDTSSSLISIESNENGIFLWLGKSNFAKFNNLHDAIYAFFLCHLAFRVKIDSRSKNLFNFFTLKFDWPVAVEQTTAVKRLLKCFA